jgi:hypothetical protein
MRNRSLEPATTPQRNVGGPVVTFCAGTRCSALRQRRDADPGLTALRSAVGRTRGGILIRSGCLGHCHLASVVLLVWRGTVAGEVLALAGMDGADRSQALADWLPGAGPAKVLTQGAALPPALEAARIEARGGRVDG